jgi:hypothetical protein
MINKFKRCGRHRTALPLPEIRFNSALKLEHATTMARYVGAHLAIPALFTSHQGTLPLPPEQLTMSENSTP